MEEAGPPFRRNKDTVGTRQKKKGGREEAGEKCRGVGRRNESRAIWEKGESLEGQHSAVKATSTACVLTPI